MILKAIKVKCEACTNQVELDHAQRPGFEWKLPDEWVTLFHGRVDCSLPLHFCSHACLRRWLKEPETSHRRLILSLARLVDNDSSGELLLARSQALKHAFAAQFPDAPKFREVSRVFADFSEWVYVLSNARDAHMDWAKVAKECGLIDSFLIDFDPEE